MTFTAIDTRATAELSPVPVMPPPVSTTVTFAVEVPLAAAITPEKPAETVTMTSRAGRRLKPTNRYQVNSTARASIDPRNLREALQGEDAAKWIGGVIKELTTLYEMGALQLIKIYNVPADTRILPSNYVVKLKTLRRWT